MINELMKVADAMRDLPKAFVWHPNMQPLPKASALSPCIRVWLTSDGLIERLERLTPEHAGQLRKFAPNKFSSLPGFNITHVSGMPDDKRKKELKKTLEGLERNFYVAREEIERRIEGRPVKSETLTTLLAIVGKLDAEAFWKAFDTQILNNDWGWKPVPGKKISVFLDIKEYAEYPVAHVKTLERLSMLLSAVDNECLQARPADAKDAYDGDADGVNALFSDITLPRLLGQIKIRSLNKDIPAQGRYHLIGSATFPVGNTSRERTQSALEWISALENEGATFGIAGDNELLFAYPTELPPDSLPQLATLLGVQRKDVLEEQKFKVLAESVIVQLKGTGEATKNSDLEIFSLRKMDKARTKVVYYHNTTVASIEAASRMWDAGFKNIPPLDVRTWGAGKNEKGKPFSIPVEPQTLFPVRLHKILNVVWTLSRNEVKQSKVNLFEPSTGLRLLLDSPEVAQTTYVTERFLAHSQTYFIALCRAKGRNEIADRKDLPNLETYPGVLGMLLYKLGKTKESYMNESAFQLGRFLRIADEIHRLYCEVVRPNDKLPELCGSSLLSPMLESPLRAFNQLTIRVTPYLKWVKRFHGEEKSGLAHYWVHQWATIADALHKTNWPVRPSPEERAQIFLGYLSSFPKSEKPETSTETTELEGTQQ
ncbi:MAG: hypothetical protein RBT78_13725 [Kiritimatiellia bacterium]|jgi:hypothetical protein|nr:hypothetical protein [Kiritimatiellia bacterium]